MNWFDKVDLYMHKKIQYQVQITNNDLIQSNDATN